VRVPVRKLFCFVGYFIPEDGLYNEHFGNASGENLDCGRLGHDIDEKCQNPEPQWKSTVHA
jgi:hypothetical protein